MVTTIVYPSAVQVVLSVPFSPEISDSSAKDISVLATTVLFTVTVIVSVTTASEEFLPTVVTVITAVPVATPTTLPFSTFTNSS